MTLEEGRGNGFGEDVSNAVGSGAEEEQNGTVKNLLPSVLVLNFNVLRPSMEDRVVCNCHAALIVAKTVVGACCRKPQSRRRRRS